MSRSASLYQSTLKSADTEEFIDLWFYRPLGFRTALLADKLHITPNMITVASIFIGAAAGILFYYNTLWINCIGMLLLVIANLFDSTDGQLARMTNNKTKLGRILDGFAGNIWFVIIYTMLAFRVFYAGFYGWSPILIWALAIAAGISHIQHAAIADYYRNIHLYFMDYGKGGELDYSQPIGEELRACRFMQDPVRKVMLWFYRNYTKQQESLTHNFQRFISVIRVAYPHNELPETLCVEFRAQSKPLMKYTNILQFNTRVIALFICLFFEQPFLYFFFDLLVLNVIMLYMIGRHEKMCKRFYAGMVNV
jgi:phosphatidylglycerophosphate synthase